MWVGLLFRGCEKEWRRKTLLRWLLKIATILHWSLKPILHSLEQWTSWLRLPPSHQGDIIYIMRRCHSNKAPVSMGVVDHGGGGVPRCLPTCARGRSAVVTHAHPEAYALSLRERESIQRDTFDYKMMGGKATENEASSGMVMVWVVYLCVLGVGTVTSQWFDVCMFGVVLLKIS